ncbi:MAG: GAF domain-containing protein [Leptolyngbyaceae cyanobacterium bins.302]|nr:GAF domain-containing protein [Leptolyngbyaceae cyanobacterium bins.302]
MLKQRVFFSQPSRLDIDSAKMLNPLLLVNSFIPHGHCYLWKPELVSLHIVSDTLTALAYYSITLTLIYFVYKRQDIPYPWVFLLFGAFIVACGTTHIMDVWTLWHPTYWLSGIIKALTAGTSVFTALRLMPLVPNLLALPSSAELETANQGLEQEVAERQRVEKILRQQADRERLLGVITQHIRQSLDLNEVLHTTVDEVRQFLRIDRVVIYRFSSNWTGNIIAESVSPDTLAISGQTIYDPCFENQWQELYRQGRISAIADIYTENIQPCHFNLLQSLQVRANLVLPILYDNTLWGLLVAHHCSAPRHWESWEVGLLRQLMTPLNIAIQQAQLHQQVQQLNASLEQQVQERTAQLQRALEFESLLKRITDKVRDSLDEDQILQTAVQELALGLGVVCCDVGFYNADKTTCTICNEYTTTLSASKGYEFQIAETIAQSIHDQLFQGITSQFCFTSDTLIRAGQAEFSSLACPLMDNEEVLGNLWLFKPKQQAFNELEIRLVEQVANQCAIAVRQARLYDAAQEQVTELERLNRLKDDFLNTVSHELRTPMSNIKMSLEMLEISLKPVKEKNRLPDTVNHYFQILQDETHREIHLINDLLDLARLDAGTEPLASTTIDLKLWIPHIAESFEARTRQQQQQLQINIPQDLPPFATDLGYFERILTELINNACKYTPSGATITVSASIASENLLLTVGNTGVEIPTRELDRIFDKFYRIPSLDPWKHGGTGLGLALVKKLVENLGGTIHAASDAGEVIFTVLFPLVVNSE